MTSFLGLDTSKPYMTVYQPFGQHRRVDARFAETSGKRMENVAP